MDAGFTGGMGIPLAIVKDDIKKDHPEWFDDEEQDDEDEQDEDQLDDRWGAGGGCGVIPCSWR